MIETCCKIRKLFELGKDSIDLPYFHSFPNNSCEGASLFLGAYLKEAFENKNIFYIKGYDKNGSIHFWLEIDGKIYDPTLDQFDGFDLPLWGAENHPLETIYFDHNKQDILTAFQRSNVTTSAYKNSLMIEIRYFLTEKIHKKQNLTI